ncbi:ribonuclease P protein component [Cephaloticoccus capnophilus]|uniref:ribonuclease P protein component n=1 Tax=Cephaloticoccus capnophilus TaxID=1548208 RepID=UPI00083859F2|nr:ribonuclease P protein component [Cephaloticoccus capnophilus]
MPRATRLLPEQHLRTQSDFQTVRQAGRRHQCDAFTAWWLACPKPASIRPDRPLTSRPQANASLRLGVVASRAAVGNAVQRNRAKRRLRALFRLHQQKLPPDGDLLLVARRLLNGLPWAVLETRFADLCRRLGNAR